MKVVNSVNAPAAVGAYSQAWDVNGFVFTSGQLPINPNTGMFISEDVAEQATQSLRNVKAILEESGSSMDKVVKTTVLLTDINDFAAVNTAYAEAFGEHQPARSCFAVAALPMGAKVEIEVIAAK